MSPEEESATEQLRLAQRIQLLVFPVVLLLITATAVVMAFDFPSAARRVPLTVGIPTLLLAVATVIFETRRFRQPKRLEVHIEKSERIASVPQSAKGAFTESKVFASYTLLAVCYLLLGFPVGAFVFLIAFVWLIGGRDWRKAVVVSVAFVLPFQVILVGWFNVSALDGWLFS